ncbi:MAG: YkvA family protein [Pseudomonadota bacterium]|nr:YkvA family protein [Pseudomonadota bacterium]
MDRTYAEHLNGMDAGAQERLVRDGFAAKVRRFGKRIPFVRDAAAAYYAMLDPNVPMLTRAALVAPLAYLVMPVDAVPDFIAGLGFTDDLVVILAALRSFGNRLGPEHYAKADDLLDDNNG